MLLYTDFAPLIPGARPGKGPVPARYAFVGIAPSPNRPAARANEPFGARSWETLRRILSQAPGSVYLTNLIKEPHPIGKKIGVRLLRKYRPILLRELEAVQPDRILVLGTEPAKALCPGFKEMKDDHGVLFLQPELSHALNRPVMVVPTYHFAAVGRDPSLKPRMARDLERFFTLPLPEPPKYQIQRKKPPRLQPGCVVTIDLETTGFNPWEPGSKIYSVGIGVDYSDTVLLYKDHEHGVSQEVLQALWEACRDAGATLRGQNLQFDLYWLNVHSGRDWVFPVQDTMLIAHNSGHEFIGLKHLTTMLTDRPGPHAFGGFTDDGYAAEDIHSTKEVYHALTSKRVEAPFIDTVVHRAVPEVARNRKWGVWIDRPLLRELEVKYTQETALAEAELNDLFGVPAGSVNWKSVSQVVPYFTARGIPLEERTKAGKLTIKESVLLTLAREFKEAQALLDYRAVEKTLSGFIHNYLERTTPDNPILHPNMKLDGAKTGRTSCVDPNLQQVTRTGPLKLLFKPRWHSTWWLKNHQAYDLPVPTHPGYFGLIDLSQAELRAACLIAEDDAFAEALLSEDVHRTNAAKVFHYDNPADVPAALRKKVKGVVFGVLYGGSPVGLANRIGVGVDEVEMILEGFFGQFPKLAKWLKMIKRFGQRNGYVEDMFGRRRDLTTIMMREGPGSVARKACNTPVQGLASHMALTIYGYTSQHLRDEGLYSRVLFGVHDSTILEVWPGEEQAVAKVVQDAFVSLNDTPLSQNKLWDRLPIVGELVLGSSWAAVESTSDYYEGDKNLTFPCSSQGIARLAA